MSRLVPVLALTAVLLAGCGDDDRHEASPAPRVSPGAPEIFEHERAGHVPASLVPGTWLSNQRTLVLGDVDEVVLDGEELGTYRAHMEEFEFATDVAGCEEATWSFDEGDLVLSGGDGCPLSGRWRRAP